MNTSKEASAELRSSPFSNVAQPHLERRRNNVPDECVAQWYWRSLVEENLHQLRQKRRHRLRVPLSFARHAAKRLRPVRASHLETTRENH